MINTVSHLRCFLLVAILASNPASAESFELTGNTFPPNYYTLIAPYAGSVDYMAEVGSIVSPIPTTIPPNGLGTIDILNYDLVKAYEKEARPVSLARILETRPGEQEFLTERSRALRDEFEIYNLKLYDVSPEPWDGMPPAKATIARKFFELYTKKSNSPFKFMRQQDATKELDFYNAKGFFGEEIKGIINDLLSNLHFATPTTTVDESVVAALVYLARSDEYSFYSVYPTPDTGDAYEPNNTLLIKPDGRIKIITSRGGRMDNGPVESDPSLRNFCNYWKYISERKLMNDQDRYFLDSINYQKRTSELRSGQPAGVDVSHEVILSKIQTECGKAVNTIYEGTRLGTLINITSRRPFTKNVTANEQLLRETAVFWTNGVKFNDAVLNEVARSFAIVAPYPADPKKPYDFRLPPPASSSAARVVNELRPSFRFDGEYLSAAEREGYLLLRKDSDWYDYKLKLWRLDIPLGGNGDNGEFFITVNNEARTPKDRRFNDLERLYDIEVRTAIEISPAFVSVSRAESFDVVASALRQFEYSKIEAGRAIRIEAENIRKTQESLQEAFRARGLRYQYGYFFVPEDSIVTQVNKKPGEQVAAGSPLAMVQPIYKTSISFKSSDRKFLRLIYPGRENEVKIDCDNYLETTSPTTSKDVNSTLNRIASEYFSKENTNITINSVVQNKDISGNITQAIMASLEIKNTPLQLPITPADALILEPLRKFIHTDHTGQNFLTPPGSLIPPYATCKLLGEW